jgi:hypothetical protein
MFENKILRGICGLTRDEIVGGWRKFREEEHDNMYYSPNTIRMNK